VYLLIALLIIMFKRSYYSVVGIAFLTADLNFCEIKVVERSLYSARLLTLLKRQLD